MFGLINNEIAEVALAKAFELARLGLLALADRFPTVFDRFGSCLDRFGACWRPPRLPNQGLSPPYPFAMLHLRTNCYIFDVKKIVFQGIKL